MKTFFQILFALLPLLSISQRKRNAFLTPDSLSRQLTSPYTNDRDKVAAIFSWITDNISYNVRPRYNARNTSSTHMMDDPDDTCALKPLSERVAIDVLDKRIAFCDGYSRLFKTLCDYAGIRSEVITGYSGVNSSSRNRFSSNHRWNAVYLDSAWYLLDATWASGYITFGDEFIRHYNNEYFLTSPQVFVRDHYPEDLQWTLLPQPPVLSEFRHSPFKTNAFVKNKILSYTPQSGFIEATEGDTLHFDLETADRDKKLVIIDIPFVDSATISNATLDSSKSSVVINGSNVSYTYVVASASVEWLNIVFNDETIMRYRLSVRKRMAAAIQ